jgi:hypothetical protein
MEVAVTLKLIARKELTRVIVDPTVQEKSIAYPTDSKLLETVRAKVAEATQDNNIELKQTYAKKGKDYKIRWLLRMIAKQGLRLLLCQLSAVGLLAVWLKLAEVVGLKSLQGSDQRWVRD